MEVTAFGVSDFKYMDTTDVGGNYVIKGYWGTAGKPAKYKLKFDYGSYETVCIDNIEVEEAVVTEQNIKLEKINVQMEMEENMVAMTGFGCDELIPKYLIGANCEGSKKLKGDASDIAMWIYPVK